METLRCTIRVLVIIISIGYGPCKVWGVTAPTPIQKVEKFNLAEAPLFVTEVKYNPVDVRAFYTVTFDGVVTAWKEGQSDPVWITKIPIENGFESIESIQISHDGLMLVAVGGGDTIAILSTFNGSLIDSNYSTEDSKTLPVITHHAALALEPAGEFFATADFNGFVYLWRFGEPSPVTSFQASEFPIYHLKFSEQGDFLVVGSNREAKIWNLNLMEPVFDIKNDIESGPTWIDALYLPPYESIIVITSFHDAIIFDLSSKSILKRFPIRRNEENPNDAKEITLQILIDENLETVWRFYKVPLVEKIDIESGEVIEAYEDPFFNRGGFNLIFQSSIDIKPGTKNEFVVVTAIIEINIFTGEFKTRSELRRYVI